MGGGYGYGQDGLPVPVLRPPKPALVSDPGRTIARMGLGLTVYLDEPDGWGRGRAVAVLDRFLEIADKIGHIGWFWSSARNRWARLEQRTLNDVRNDLGGGAAIYAHPRPQLRVCLADQPGAPALAFVYNEGSSRQAHRRGYLRIMLPTNTPPDELLSFAIELAQTAPIHAGIGGYEARYDIDATDSAFKSIYGWCLRYLGLHVSNPDRVAYRLGETRLPAVGWLTVVGNPLRERWLADEGFDLDALDPSVIQVMSLSRATILKAGNRPVIGDRHLGEYPSAVHAAWQALGRFTLEEPPTLPGRRFGEEPRTRDWYFRFLEPDAWT